MQTRWSLLFVVLACAACSKNNSVTVNNKDDAGNLHGTLALGDACDAPNACAESLSCVFSFCRQTCATDSECEGGSVCFFDGQVGGCRLPPENACGDGAACGDPLLTCGLDQSCRLACSAQKSCPRSDQQCIAGACVSTTESGYDKSYGTCDPADQGKYLCAGTTLSSCDVGVPGKVVIGDCATPELCAQGANEKAAACPVCGSGGATSRCNGTNAETCNATHTGFDAVDCAQSTEHQCNPADGQCLSLSVDAHEVTRDDYAAKVSSFALGTGACSQKQSAADYAPDATCLAKPDVCQGSACGAHPQVCVDWCDASAYCAAVGKHLCGRIGGGMVQKDLYDDAGTSEWMNACSSGGQYAFTFGAWTGPSSGQACNGTLKGIGTTAPAGSLATCQSDIATYAGLFDLTGNVAEWENACDKTESSGSSSDACRVRGGSYQSTDQASLGCNADRTLPRNGLASDVGFRCCG
jgi:sulfatase modifying factor 1